MITKIKRLFIVSFGLLLIFGVGPAQYVQADSSHMNHSSHNISICASLCASPSRHEEQKLITRYEEKNELEEANFINYTESLHTNKPYTPKNEHWVDKTPFYIRESNLRF